MPDGVCAEFPRVRLENRAHRPDVRCIGSILSACLLSVLFQPTRTLSAMFPGVSRHIFHSAYASHEIASDEVRMPADLLDTNALLVWCDQHWTHVVLHVVFCILHVCTSQTRPRASTEVLRTVSRLKVSYG